MPLPVAAAAAANIWPGSVAYPEMFTAKGECDPANIGEGSRGRGGVPSPGNGVAGLHPRTNF